MSALDPGATRTVGGVELPAPGVWRVDPGHAEVAFIGRHFMLTKVRGRFPGVEGAVTVAEDPDASRVEVTIDMASVNSGDRTRDEHLALETGGILVSKEIRVEIEVETIREDR